MRKNQPKLNWSEMNKKQKAIFIINWILRGVLIVLALIMVLTMFVNCFKSCGNKDESSVAYAESASLYKLSDSYDFNNSISTYPYISYSGSSVSGVGNVAIDIYLHSLPLIEFTVELILNNNSEFYNLVIFGNNGADVLLGSLSSSNDYFTFSASQIESYDYIRLVIGGAGVNLAFFYDFTLYFYAGSYVPGYGQGLAAGIQQGKSEGAELAQYGLFQNATFDAVFTYEDNSELTVTNIKPSYISNGIYFGKNLQSAYEVYNGNYIESAEITINFKDSFSYSNDLPFMQQYDTDVRDFSLIDINNKRYTGEFLYVGLRSVDFSYVNGQGYVENTLGMSPVRSMVIYYGRASDTFFGSTIMQIDGNYLGGYDVGYNRGFEDGSYSKNEASYNSGYSDGFQEGFNQSESGGFGWLISSVQAFLDTKFFGDFGIGTLLYVSLGVLLVMYFLKVLAGG